MEWSGSPYHLLSRWITLDTLVNDLVHVLAWEELDDVVLVAHSLNGAVAQAVAARVPHCLAQLDEFLVRDGKSVVDTSDPTCAAGIQQWVDAAGEGWCVPRLEPAGDSVDARQARGSHTAFPWRPSQEPVGVGGPPPPTVAQTFVLCTDREESPVDAAILASAQRARADGWTTLDFRAGADVDIAPAAEPGTSAPGSRSRFVMPFSVCTAPSGCPRSSRPG